MEIDRLLSMNLNLRRGTELLLEDADLTVYPGQKLGLVGANGCGKSSLFALIRGELHPDAGECSLPPGWEIAHVAQQTPSGAQPASSCVRSSNRRSAGIRAMQTVKCSLHVRR